MEGCYTCPRCQCAVQYYQKGDTIPLLVTTSTLARTQRELFVEEGVCTHFEVIELSGAKISEMNAVLSPIVEFLCKYNKLEVLVVVGVNDLAQKGEDTKILDEAVENFEIFTKFWQIFDCNVKFIQIPLIPSLSKLSNDTHEVRFDRTNLILHFNKVIDDYNRLGITRAKVPSLLYSGIKREGEGQFPDGFAHIPECWDNWDTNIPKKNCVHLDSIVKRCFWPEIQESFKLCLSSLKK